jgi:hypothetical protein
MMETTSDVNGLRMRLAAAETANSRYSNEDPVEWRAHDGTV